MGNLPKAFFSYSRINKDRVTFFQEELKKRGVEIWRDEENLQGGQQWPKELGDAIAACPCFLLFWSKEAKESHYIELEWSIAFALKRQIIPCRLDDTPLPNSLRAYHDVNLQAPEIGLANLLFALEVKVPKFIPDLNREAEVLTSLSKIPSADSQSVLSNFHSIIIQHKWDIQRDRNIIAGRDINITVTSSPIGERDIQLQNLLQNVEQSWIKEVLKNSLQHMMHIELGMEIDLTLVNHPQREVREIPLPEVQQLPAMYEQQKSLLILGKPGSGKTTSLLELAKYLVDLAATDPRQPIPVVFNLSTWTDQHKSFFEWLLEEFRTKFDVRPGLSKKWLSKHWCVLLLDGLDEIAAQHRLSCVNAINAFRKDVGVPGIAVCSRLQEYKELQSRFQFKVGLILEPLSNIQVNYLLKSAGLNTHGLRQLMETDEDFRNLMQTPLFLSILILTFKDHPEEVIELEKIKTTTEWQKHLFEKYVERMFQRKGQRKLLYSPTVMKNGLSWLAQQMMKHSQTVFLLENLQPSWLSSRGARWCYWLGSRTLSAFFLMGAGIIPGIVDGFVYEGKTLKTIKIPPVLVKGIHLTLHCLAFFLLLFFFSIDNIASSEEPLWAWIGVGMSSIFVGLLFGIRGINRNKELDIKTFEGIGWSNSRAKKGFIIGNGLAAITWVGYLLPILLLPREVENWDYYFFFYGGFENYLSFFMFPLFCADTFLSYLVYAADTPPDAVGHKLRKRLKLRDNILNSRQYIRIILILSLLFIIPFSFAIYQKEAYNAFFADASLPIKVILILIFNISYRVTTGLSYGLFGYFFGIKRKGIDRKIYPNQGIKRTFYNSIFIGLTAPVLIIVFIIGTGGTSFLVEIRKEDVIIFSLTCLLYGGFFAFISGIPDVIQHFLLRLLLWIKGHTVLRFYHFLETAKDLLFLRRVGGGYIFVHRLLLEYFAELKNPVSNLKVETKKVQML